MSRWEHRYLGQERFPDALSTMEIEHFSSLSEDELRPSDDGGPC
jgi:hypothetical protein